ncbi:Cobyric acid synthase [Methanoculleus chikugoensis]|jgi:adenosylcobyric acid synthase|uniref:Probable cobyric acid synthase n=1 Tax=Methanoculleus chikugoensis TaxID=118126 RepID=A0A1M4MHQ5_9EURY|nr:cobyric acid synthase [Methanoculleus chikugoensis]SCL74459.1 Cobyric acid synthase [Methanoculleus chikugoensis]
MSLIVLGTASHVGKSVTVAALCRALYRRGIPVAPFKSQNMSLNSYVTADGSEIGIAQAVQAFAAGVEPEADMNPVLLKPKGDSVSQVVLLGRPYKDVQIRDYYRETDALLTEAVAAFERLQRQFGNVVAEGAGGAAEVNLYDRDIANIRLARSLRLPILLVADIERGGVFAQVYGTLALLPEDIRPLVAGVIVNKFRGDPGLFASGVTKLEELTGVPVLGVVPFADIPLPSEDSLSIADKKERSTARPVRIAVLRLPRIANFTDFELLEEHATVDYVPPGATLSGYDCIILPGTKNTVEDLAVLNRHGVGEELRLARERGVPIIGICGGYQMLGSRIVDAGIESESPAEYPGFGLLDVVTAFSGYRKTTVQVRRRATGPGPILPAMGEVEGYEIHMGETERGELPEAFDGEGASTPDGLVFGTYMHGLFRNPGAVNALLAHLSERRGVAFEPVTDASAGALGAADAYDELARHFEEHVDMEAIMAWFRDGERAG